ncbi:MAG: magnesium transporter CorA family protein [Bacillota bacterium]|nr:magnesium transporter CorA family protein [Bacillota bacterium]
MISIYKTAGGDANPQLIKIDAPEEGCWINVVSPTEQELLLLSKKTGAPIEFLQSALDEEETSRIDYEGSTSLFIVDIPFTEMEDNSLTYDTYPLAIVHTDTMLISVCLKNSKVLTDFIDGKIKTFFTFKKSRFTLQILYRIAIYYLVYLRQIDKKSLMIQKKLQISMKNKEVIQLLSLEKSLVYFSTSLKSNEITLEKMLKIDLLQKYPDDKDVLEDVIIENKQAIEMANIYSNILSGTMDAYASIISNNLNIVMKFLASVTIVLSIPTLIYSLYGMNVKDLPFENSPHAFPIILGISIAASLIAVFIFNKKDML